MKKFVFVLALILVMTGTLFGCKEAYSLSFSAAEYTVEPGVSFVPSVKIKPKNQDYSITSANNSIARVENNAVTTLKEGIVKLTVTSGKKSASSTLYIRKDAGNNSGGITILQNYTVNFEIVNYEDADLETGALESMIALEGSFLNINAPSVTGYEVDCWYSDKGCTQKYNLETPIHSNFTLYAKITPRDLTFKVLNGYITGVTYPNLPHEELVFPEKENNGNIIYGIADNAFSGDQTIKKVTLPASYRTIGSSAFAGCSKLEKVEVPSDSELSVVGTNAFGVTKDESGAETPCSALTELFLPDSVTRVADFAFYKCSALVLDGIPNGLHDIETYAFAYTKINNVDFSNINSIREGGFMNCLALDTVMRTENVSKCYKFAFDGTKLSADGMKKYNESKLDDDAAFYAGTILYGCMPRFGKLLGSGKFKIKAETTLIADHALNKEDQSELTIDIETDKAHDALVKGKTLIGNSAFADSDGVFIAVSSGDVKLYQNKYSTGDTNFKERFVVREVITVVGDDNAEQTNWGKHVILKKTGDSTRYYYDRFIPFESGTPKQIKLSFIEKEQGRNIKIVRVNMGAFATVKNLWHLELSSVQTIAHIAISGCTNLTEIDLTQTVSPAVLESKLSIQVTSVHTSCKVLVKEADLGIYKKQWDGTDIAKKLLGR